MVWEEHPVCNCRVELFISKTKFHAAFFFQTLVNNTITLPNNPEENHVK
jgi:hypothetical protein